MCVFIFTLHFHEQTSGVALCKAAFFFLIFNALFLYQKILGKKGCESKVNRYLLGFIFRVSQPNLSPLDMLTPYDLWSSCNSIKQ